MAICNGGYIGHGHAISTQNIIRHNELTHYSHSGLESNNFGGNYIHNTNAPYENHGYYEEAAPSVAHSESNFNLETNHYQPLAIYASQYKTYVSII